MSGKESDSLIHRDPDAALTSASHGIKCQYSLGGKTYEIDPSRIKSASFSILRTAITWFMLLVLSPLLLLVSMVLVAIMYMGPLSLQHGILSTMIPFIMKRQAERFGPERDILLGGIMDNDEVLDIGCGGGAYLRHYTKVSNIVALEPVVDMHDGIRQVAKQVGIPNKNLTILPLTLEEYVNSMQQSGMQKQQFDWIIVGNVLCEVSNPMVTLQSIKILTKPGGHVYFSEHEGATSGTWARLIQDIINPFWVTISGGCNCNRDILQMVRSALADDWELAIWEYPHIQVAMGPSFLGLARKT